MAEPSIEDKFDVACMAIADLTIENHRLEKRVADSKAYAEKLQDSVVRHNNAFLDAISMLGELLEETPDNAPASVVRGRLTTIKEKMESVVPF